MASPKDRRAFWEHVIAEQRNSGLTGRAWCQRNGVALEAFYLWRKKLTADPPLTTSAVRRSSDIQWLPIEPAKSTATVSAPSGVTLRVGTIDVEIASGFDPRALSDIIAVLTSRC